MLLDRGWPAAAGRSGPAAEPGSSTRNGQALWLAVLARPSPACRAGAAAPDQARARPGTRDFLPEDLRVRQWLFGEFAAVSRLFGFEQFETPVLEAEALFTRKAGDEITQQLYNFEARAPGRWLRVRRAAGRSGASCMLYVARRAPRPCRSAAALGRALAQPSRARPAARAACLRRLCASCKPSHAGSRAGAAAMYHPERRSPVLPCPIHPFAVQAATLPRRAAAQDKGGRRVALRPELTPSLARLVLAQARVS